jgi:hypothetical protein
MLNRIALALVVVTLALPAVAGIHSPDVFFDFSSTQGFHSTAASPQAPAAFVAGKVDLGPSLGRLNLRGQRRVRVADQRVRDDDVALVLVLKDDDTFTLRHPDGTAFRGEIQRAIENRRKLDLFLFPPDGQRFIERNVAHSFGFHIDVDPQPDPFDDDRTRIVAKINRDGDRVKLKVRIGFRAEHEGEYVTGGARLVLIVDLDD